MREHELISLHYALWQSDCPRVIAFRDRLISVIRVNDILKKFVRININSKISIITQNMHTPSRWTAWVNEHDNGKVTWVLKNNKYVGQVLSWYSDGMDHIRVLKLNPECMLFEGSTKDILGISA